METMATTKTKKAKPAKAADAGKSKRKYETDVLSKLEDGKSWKYLMNFDNDVAKAIVKERQDSPTGGEYHAIINNRLRKSYGLKTKK